MVLAAPGPLLTPPPSFSPPETPHLSYSLQTRSQNEEKNPPPKPYLPLQTRTRHTRSHRPHPMCKVDQKSALINTCHDARFAPQLSAPMLMRGNTPPNVTTRSPPHRSRPAGYPPNRQPGEDRESMRWTLGVTRGREISLARSLPLSFPFSLAVICWSPCAQRRCYPTGRCT